MRLKHRGDAIHTDIGIIMFIIKMIEMLCEGWSNLKEGGLKQAVIDVLMFWLGCAMLIGIITL